MKAYGQLESAQLEVVSADPSLLPVGRILFNKTDGYAKISDEGNVLTKFLLNDDKTIIGTSGTAASNIRLFRAGAGILQAVFGGDVTAEGSLSATPAIISSRQESYANAGLPAVGNAGRLAYVTDQTVLKVDTGAAWRSILTSQGSSFDAQTQKIINVVDPVGLQDVATKNYVDSSTSANGAIPYALKSADYTALTSDQALAFDATGAARTLALYTAVGNVGKQITVKKIDASANTVTVDGAGAETIDGALTVVLSNQYDVVRLLSDGANWIVLSKLNLLSSSLVAQTFTANGNFVVPLGISVVSILGAGAGGGGGGGSNNPNPGGGGGGAGSAPFLTTLSVIPGETLTIALGAGGASGLGSNTQGAGVATPGGTGGNTTVTGSTSGLLATFYGAPGGEEGSVATATTGVSSRYGVVFINGGPVDKSGGALTAVGGDPNVYQAGVSGAGPGGFSGAGGGSGFGVGGNGSNSSVDGVAAAANTSAGGGGGGGNSAATGHQGGLGGSGKLIIYY